MFRTYSAVVACNFPIIFIGIILDFGGLEVLLWTINKF
jgi:hypothetical protein